MCQAIPRKVLRAEPTRAEVLIDAQPTWVTTLGLSGLTPGEYITVYAGAAIERISEEDALELLEFLETLGSLFDEAEAAQPTVRGGT